tara:strand:- start:373 stop:993 length:621 start_codon:yes stop_codon:yes gene_type:complete
MKKIAVFGATGGTGHELTRQAIDAGHDLHALVRNPKRLGIHETKLRITIGDVLEEKDVEQCVAGSDAVICSLGTGPNSPSNVTSEGTKNIIAAMEKHNVDRLIVVSSLGVGDSKNQIPKAFKIVAATILRKVMIDKEKQENFVMGSKLKWTIVRPGGLTNGPQTNCYRVGTGPDIIGKRVSRADVADFLLNVLHKEQYVQQAVAIT